jgi:hypothetical protein
MLFQGEPYADFIDTHKPPSFTSACDLVDSQTDIIAESLATLRKPSTRSRRQSVTYLLEQCILLTSLFRSCDRPREKRRMARVARIAKRALSAVRKGD